MNRCRATLRVLVTLLTLVVWPGVAPAQRLMEKLGRGVVAVREGADRVFVGWRMLGTDPDEIAFNVYRREGAATGEARKLNDQPVRNVTFFVDEQDVPRTGTASYFVRPVVNGQEQAASRAFDLPAEDQPRPYLPIPLRTPGGYSPNDASVGDLDGDGEYEVVLHQVGVGKDNSHRGVTTPPILQAYKLDGTMLWEINLGRNIREGAHYTQFMVYDLDSDGRAEVVCKTADGTTDGKGKIIGDPNANHVNAEGHILKGPEFLTVFDGPTGAALATEKYVPARTENNPENPDLDEYKRLWRDNYGNRSERYLAAVAYLDGERPSVVMCRGYYERTTLTAWDWRDGKLTRRWTFDTGPDRSNPYFGQGNHSLAVADVDDDGKDEIIYGGMCVDDDGTGLWSTGLGHGDAHHVSDLDPTRPGLEMFRIQERFGDAGAHMVDLKTGNVLWRKPSVRAANQGGDRGEGPGRGLAADIDPRHPGKESWTLGAGIAGVWDAKGHEIGTTKPTINLAAREATFGVDADQNPRGREVPTCNFRVYWDGDVLDELLDRNQILKWDWEKQQTRPLLVAEGCTSNNGTKATPTLSADILGDWREEVIWPTTDGKELRVYISTIPTDRRLYTLMHDPVYRLAIAWQNVAYNQPPHAGFYIGPDMRPPPKPKVKLIEPKLSARR